MTILLATLLVVVEVVALVWRSEAAARRSTALLFLVAWPSAGNVLGPTLGTAGFPLAGPDA